MNRSTGFALTLSNLFIGKKFKEKGLDKPTCAKILESWIYTAIVDILYNDVEISLPNSGSLGVHKIPREEFISKRKLGSFQDIDFLATNFTSQRIMLEQQYVGQKKLFPVYIARELKKFLVDQTNKGVQYYGKIKKTWQDYLQDINAKFIKFSESEIRNVIFFGLKRLMLALRSNCTIFRRSKLITIAIGYIAVSYNSLVFYKRKLLSKLLFILRRKPPEYDGYYYFWQENWKLPKTKSGKKQCCCGPKLITLYRYKTLCQLSHKGIGHILRVKISPKLPFMKIKFFGRICDVKYVCLAKQTGWMQTLWNYNNYLNETN